VEQRNITIYLVNPTDGRQRDNPTQPSGKVGTCADVFPREEVKFLTYYRGRKKLK
jgi:hypothetical protein